VSLFMAAAKFFLILFHTVLFYAKDGTIVLDTKEDMSTVPIGKGANRIVDILGNIRSRFLELNIDSITLLD